MLGSLIVGGWGAAVELQIFIAIGHVNHYGPYSVRQGRTITLAGKDMNKIEFSKFRKKLGKTQKQLSELLGMSLKTIHSYEQGWRTIPPHIERQLFFLIINQRQQHKQLTPCWEKKECAHKESCPAWEFQSGHLCWFLCGTLCECTNDANSREKLDICRSCSIFTSLIE